MAQACDELEVLLNGTGFNPPGDDGGFPGGDPYVDASYEPVE